MLRCKFAFGAHTYFVVDYLLHLNNTPELINDFFLFFFTEHFFYYFLS